MRRHVARPRDPRSRESPERPEIRDGHGQRRTAATTKPWPVSSVPARRPARSSTQRSVSQVRRDRRALAGIRSSWAVTGATLIVSRTRNPVRWSASCASGPDPGSGDDRPEVLPPGPLDGDHPARPADGMGQRHGGDRVGPATDLEHRGPGRYPEVREHEMPLEHLDPQPVRRKGGRRGCGHPVQPLGEGRVALGPATREPRVLPRALRRGGSPRGSRKRPPRPPYGGGGTPR